MKKKLCAVLLALGLLSGVLGCASAAPQEEVGLLGIGYATFWPFGLPDAGYGDSPLGLDEFWFCIYAEDVEPGSGSIELRRATDDTVLASVPVEGLTYTAVTRAGQDGTDTAATEVYMKLDAPLMEAGTIYMHIPAGAFRAGNRESKEITGADKLTITMADYGFAPSEYSTDLKVGETASYEMLIGSASQMIITVEGDAVTADQTVMEADGTITVTAVAAGEAIVYVDFMDAEGNILCTGQTNFTCS